MQLNTQVGEIRFLMFSTILSCSPAFSPFHSLSYKTFLMFSSGHIETVLVKVKN